MSEFKTIIKQLSVSYILKGLRLIISFIYFLLITRNLSIDDYGILSIILLSITILTQIFSFNLYQFFIKDLANLKTNIKIAKITSVNIYSIFLGLVGLFLLFLFKSFILSFLDLKSYTFLFILSLFIVGFKLFFFPYVSFMTSEKKLILLNFISFFISQGWMLLIIFILLLGIEVNLFIIIWLYLITTIIIFAYLFVYHFIKYKTIFFSIKFKELLYFKKGLKFSLPLITLIITQWILTASDRYFLNFYYSSFEVGQYSYLYSLLGYFVIISGIVFEILYSYIADYYKSNKKIYNLYINTGIKYSFLLVLPMLGGFYILDKEILSLISGTKYLSILSLLPILIWFPLLQVLMTILDKPLLLSSKTKIIGVVYFIAMFLNLVLNYFLIPNFGIKGASIATVLSYIFIVVTFYYYSKNYFIIDWSYLKLIKIIFSTIVMMLIINLFNVNVFYQKFLLILFGGLIYFVLTILLQVYSKNEIKLLKNLFKIK